MQVSVESTSVLGRRVTIAVPAQRLQEAVEANLAETRSSLRLPGFRPGKVPMKEVRRRCGAAARSKAAGVLMQTSLAEALERESLAPASPPALEILAMEPEADFRFAATFELMPQIDLCDFAELRIVRPCAEITEADLDDMVERLRHQRREWDPVDRPAKDGDRVTVDFEGALNGEPYEGHSGKGLGFVLGAGQVVPGFEEAARGARAGEDKRFDAAFPENYHAAAVAGKTVQFQMRVAEVAESRLPIVDEAFFKAFGVEQGGLELFRKEVAGNMRRELNNAMQLQVKQQVMDQLLERHDPPLPKALVGQEIETLRAQMVQQFGTREAAAQSSALSEDLFRKRAERRVALGLIAREIARVHGLSADADLVRERIQELAAPYAEREQVIQWYYRNPEQLSGVELAVLEDQVVEAVLQKAQVGERQCSYADLIAGKALASGETGGEPSGPQQERESE